MKFEAKLVSLAWRLCTQNMTQGNFNCLKDACTLDWSQATQYQKCPGKTQEKAHLDNKPRQIILTLLTSFDALSLSITAVNGAV